MATHGLFHISLARKCQILFGMAVLLIIAAALFVPGYVMETLVHEMNVRRARHLTMLAYAYFDPSSPDWRRQQILLDRWWADNQTLLNLPRQSPRLIPLPPPEAQHPPVTRAEVLAALGRPLAWYEDVSLLVRETFNAPLELRVVESLWRAQPPEVRRRISEKTARVARFLIRHMAGGTAALDPVQQQWVQEMRGNEKVNEKSRRIREADLPTIYHSMLGIRGSGSGQRPLIGVIDLQLPVPETDELLLFTRVILIISGMLAGFLAILVFYLISQRLILAPVRELKELVEEVAGGDLTARSAITTGDEFEALADAFNDMLFRLEGSQVELEKINRSLDTRLGELAETNVALYESNRLKSEFLANVSHELRTPLTSIIGFADLLRDSMQSGTAQDQARLTRYAHNILTSGRMLLEIINDLLDLAKIEAGKIQLHRTPFSVREVCDALIDFVRPLADKKDQTIEVALSDDLPIMNSDAGRMRQIVYNLLSNAVKYTPDGGIIHLEVHPSDDGQAIRLVVADNGPGIDPADQARIFEKFHQLDSSVTREHSGTGLGLPISRELCAMLGGSIRVESNVGEGARFIVELPVECPSTVHRPLPSLTD